MSDLQQRAAEAVAELNARYEASDVRRTSGGRFVTPDVLASEAQALAERDAAHNSAAESQMLAFKWMAAHDLLKAGKPYNLPKPADLPEALARAEKLQAAVNKWARLRAEFQARPDNNQWQGLADLADAERELAALKEPS